MKSKKLNILCFSLIFLASSFPALALETPQTGVTKPIGKERKEAAKEIKAIRQEAKTDIQQTKTELKQKQISTAISKIKASIVSRYARLLTDKTKLQSRIAERKSRGYDVTAAESKLATFSTASYTSHLAALDAQTSLAIASTTPYTQSPEIKATIKSLNTDLLDLRKVLTETIRLLVTSKTKQ